MTQAEADKDGYRGTDEGGKLKETGTCRWLSPNIGPTNSSGFSALPGSYRNSAGSYGTYGSFGNDGYWWSSSEPYAYSPYIYRRTLDYSRVVIYRGSETKGSGLSVRCVKDGK